MINFGFSKKRVAALQAFISLGLIIAAFAFALTPLFGIDTTVRGFGESGGEMKEAIAESVSDYSGDELLPSEIDNELSVSPIRLIRVLVLYGKVIKRNVAYSEDVAKDIEEWISTESGREDIIIVSALSEMMEQMGKRAGGNESGLSIIFNIVFTFLSFICTLIMTLVLPIIMLIKTISAAVSAISGRKTPERVAGKLGASLPSFMTILLLYGCVLCLSGAFTLGFGVAVIVGLGLLSALVNSLATRQMDLSRGECVYLNAVQGASAISVIGFLVYFFNIISAGAMRAFAGGTFSEYTSAAASIKVNDPSASIHSEYMADGVMMLLYVLFAAISVYYLERATRRLSLGGAKGEHNLVLSVFAVLTCIIPLIISASMHYFENPTSSAAVGDASFLPKESFGFGNLVGALVGASIMLISEIGALVLVRLFGSGASSERRGALLSGKAMKDYMLEGLSENSDEGADSPAESIENSAEKTVAAEDAESTVKVGEADRSED